MTVKNRKRRKAWIIWLVVIGLLAGVLLAGTQMLLRRINPLANVRSARAETGTIAKTITGTGSLSADDTTVDLTILDGLVIDHVLAETGDQVTAGDLLATFDDESLQTAIWNTQAQLASLDARLSQAKGKTESQYVTAAIAGRVKQIFINEGDNIQAVMAEYGALIILSLDGQMKVTIKPATTEGLVINGKVDVKLSDDTSVEGIIGDVSGSSCTVMLSDQSAPVGDQVSVSLEGQMLGVGVLEINEPLAVTATDGVAEEIRCSLNAKVSSGARLIKLKNAPVSQSFLKLYAQRLNQADRLATLMAYAHDGGFAAGQAGELLELKLADGQTTGSAVTGAVKAAVATIRTNRNILLSIKIDELDIADLTVGQLANITIDALPDLTLTGAITEIADIGTPGQNSSSFTVKIDVPDDPGLRLGLTATAVITAEKHDNIIKLPLEALQESGGEQFVYIGTARSAIDLGEKRPVTIGISDGEFVEITNGLDSGDTVNYFYATGESSLNPFRGGGIRQTSGSTAG